MLEHLLNNTADKKEVAHKKKRENNLEKLHSKKTTISPLETLNEEQLESATTNSENNLVIASAGTGKTSTIIGRVYFLIKEKNIKPKNIILLTFTNKAGKEMLERLLKYFNKEDVEKIFAGTFHAFGKRLMDKHIKGKYKLMQDLDITNLATTIYDNLISNYGVEPEKCIAPSTLMSLYSLYRNITGNKKKNKFYDYLITEKSMESQYANFYADVVGKYIEDKKKYGLIDFTDYIDYIKSYYKENKNEIQEIIVDEYQDTNKIQNDALKSMKNASGASLFCVGDFDQSIYAFNGSSVGVMQEFVENYRNSKVLFLKKNYRSSKSILNIAEKVIQNNERIFNKELIPMVNKDWGKPKAYGFQTIDEEENFIVETIQKTNYDINDIAILFRSNSSGDSIELALLANDIAVDRLDKSNFMQSPQAKFFMSFVKLKQHSNIVEAYNSLYGATYHKNVKIIYDTYIKEGRNQFYQGVASNVLTNLINSLDKEGELKSFLALTRHLKLANTPKEFFDKIEKSKFFNNYIKNIESHKYPQFSDKAISALKTIFHSSDSFKALLIRERISESEEGKYGVKLMTVHSSKGLEFKKVFIINLSAKRFPSQRLTTSIEEERRLMYVAITRAKEKLLFTYSFKKKDTKPSLFIKETGIPVCGAKEERTVLRIKLSDVEMD